MVIVCYNMLKAQLSASVSRCTALKSALVTYQKNALRIKALTRILTNHANFKNKKYSMLYQHEQKHQVDTLQRY